MGVRSSFVDLVELVWCFGQGVGVSEDSGLVRASMVDGSTFEVLFDRHHASVWAFLARSAGRQAADDLAGQVFVIAFERRASFDPALGEVRGWLIGIARNLARSQQRNDERGWRAVQRLARQREDWVDQFEDVVDTDELRREHAKVLEAIGRLAQDDRELVTMAVWDRLTYPEIATALEVPVGTVRSRLSRARQRLRELVVESGQEQVVDLQQDRPT